jgi:hypothetical protein
MSQSTPPGWYDDGAGARRWWDGAAWTSHVAEAANGPRVETPPQAKASRRGLWLGLGIGGGALALAIAAVIVALVVVPQLSRPSVADAISAYNDAWIDGDCAQYVALSTPSLQEAYAVSCEDFAGSTAESTQFSIESVDEGSDEAVVVYRVDGVDADGASFSDRYEAHLVQRDGRWLVDEETLLNGE